GAGRLAAAVTPQRPARMDLTGRTTREQRLVREVRGEATPAPVQHHDIPVERRRPVPVLDTRIEDLVEQRRTRRGNHHRPLRAVARRGGAFEPTRRAYQVAAAPPEPL